MSLGRRAKEHDEFEFENLSNRTVEADEIGETKEDAAEGNENDDSPGDDIEEVDIEEEEEEEEDKGVKDVQHWIRPDVLASTRNASTRLLRGRWIRSWSASYDNVSRLDGFNSSKNACW